MFRFLGQKVRALFSKPVDEKTLEDLEALFYSADLGRETSDSLTEIVRSLLKKDPKSSTEALLQAVKEKLKEELSLPPTEKPVADLQVILIVGTNGNGKTTSTAKLCRYFQNQGKKVLLAAADTFRAAAVEQLDLWAQKLDCEIVKGTFGSDPAAVVFDAVTAAKTRGCDVVLVDTAGRLHTKLDLMQELEKIRRVANKACPGAPHETYLVLDATIGQNGIDQALIFHKYTPLTGLILTKVDGSAKGGAVIALQKKLKLPIVYLGSGEGVEDFAPFDSNEFVEGLLA
jgi:fused signal recognition particle receptor